MRPQITKTIAAEVAKKIVAETILKKREQCIEKLSARVEQAILKHIGAATINHIRALPKGYVMITKSHTLYSYSSKKITFIFKTEVPYKRYNDGEEWDKIINQLFGKEVVEINSLIDKAAKAEAQIASALVQIRYYDNIIKEFPEAAKHLPDRNKQTTAIAVCVKDLRKEINSYNK